MVTNNPQANTALAEVRSTLGVFTGSGTSTVSVRFLNLTTGNVLAETSASGGSYNVITAGMFIDISSVAGNNTYAVQVRATAGGSPAAYNGGSGVTRALVWKR